MAEAVLQQEPTVLKLKAPIKIFGDLHGQFGDLMRLFQVWSLACLVWSDLCSQVRKRLHAGELDFNTLLIVALHFPNCCLLGIGVLSSDVCQFVLTVNLTYHMA